MPEEAPAPMISVYLVDDHAIVRDGLRAVIESHDDLTVVGEAGTATEALRQLRSLRPCVAVVDVQLPDGNGIEICRELQVASPEVRCLILTSYAEDEALFEAVLAGAAGYVLKQVGGSDLVSCIRRVAAGEELLDHRSAERVRARVREGSTDPLISQLSTQERRILDHIADGRTNRDIAAAMHLSEKTVKNYVSKVLMKMGMERRTEAAVYATRADARDVLADRAPQVDNPIRY